MVKIKDFTLASKKRGGHVPPVPYTPPAHANTLSKTFSSRNDENRQQEGQNGDEEFREQY